MPPSALATSRSEPALPEPGALPAASLEPGGEAAEFLREPEPLRVVLAALAVSMALLVLLSLLGGTRAIDLWGMSFMGLMALGLLSLPARRRRHRYIARTLVLSVIGYTTYELAIYGSAWGLGVAGYVGASILAALIMSRRAALQAALLSSACLAALTWAESAGRLATPGADNDQGVWLVPVVVLLSVALGARSSQQQTREALREGRQELARRRQAEESLVQSEGRLRKIFNSSPAAIIVQLQASQTVLDVNPAFERLFGLTREQIIGQSDAALWADETQRQTLLAAMQTQGEVVNMEARARLPDRSERIVMRSSVLEGEGAQRIMVSTLTDITQTIKAGLAARQSQELFATAFSLSPINMNISRMSDGVFLAVNAASESVQGYTPAELLGRSALDIGMWPSRQLREAFMLRLLTEEGVVSTEIAMRHKDGHLVQCCVWAARSQIAGQPCVLSCMMNVTEQKQREALLLNLAHGLSGQSGDSFFNSITRYLGNAIQADMVLIGEVGADKQVKSLSLLMDGDIVGGLNYPLAGTPCDQALDTNDLCIYSDEVHKHFPDDGLLTEGGFRSYIGVALRDADGTPIGIVSALWRTAQPQSSDREALVRIFASLTNAELIRLRRDREIEHLNSTLEQRVKERTDQLESTNAELESFGYSVSHDLQSPLRSIQGFVFLLDKRLNGRLSKEEDRLFDRVKANVLRMHELISDLLALARVSRDKLTLKTVDLSSLARQVAQQEMQREPHRQVELVIAPNVQSICDAKFARIVLENLLGNAWKYARQQAHTRIEFGVLPDLVEGRQMLFVRDNGAGFNMAYSASLFKPFHRLHHESEFEGTGIGLATVHRILERHGGTISAEAAEGSGACFYFSFDRGPGTAPA